MNTARKRILPAVAGLLMMASTAWAQPVKIAGLVELTGMGASSGTNFNNGIKLAVKEINAAGGILGRQIDYRAYDTQTNPGVARGLAEQVVSDGVYVVMGPVFSGSIMVSMAVTRQAEVPNFTGGEAAAITRQGNPYIFRTSIAQAKSMPRLVDYVQRALKARSIDLIYVSNEFGRSGREQLIQAIKPRGISLGADLAVDPGQVSYSGVVRKMLQAQGDILFVYTNEEEAARVLRELRKQGYGKPIVGENVLTSQRVIELGGEAAHGAIAHVGLTADAPNPLVQAFDRSFQKEFGARSDHNGIKGYIAMYTVKAATEKVGRFDPKAFASAMKNLTLSSKIYPGLLMDVTYDDKGDMDRESYMVRVANGRQVVIETFAPSPRN